MSKNKYVCGKHELSVDNNNCTGEFSLSFPNPLEDFVSKINYYLDILKKETYQYDENDFKEMLMIINALEQIIIHPETLHEEDKERVIDVYENMCQEIQNNLFIKQLETCKEQIKTIMEKNTSAEFPKIVLNKLEGILNFFLYKCSFNPAWEKKIWTGQNQDHGKTYYEKIGNAATWQWEVPTQGGRRYKYKTKRRHAKLKRTKRRYTKSQHRR